MPAGGEFVLHLHRPSHPGSLNPHFHRAPEALDKACFILSGIDTVGLLQAMDTAVSMVKNGVRGKMILPPYGKEFFTYRGKQIFTLHGNQFFT